MNIVTRKRERTTRQQQQQQQQQQQPTTVKQLTKTDVSRDNTKTPSYFQGVRVVQVEAITIYSHEMKRSIQTETRCKQKS